MVQGMLGDTFPIGIFYKKLKKIQYSSIFNICGITKAFTYLYIHTFLLQTYFNAPEGNNPVAIRMKGMGKGMVWVNGKSIGRYWVSFLSPLGKPSQLE